MIAVTQTYQQAFDSDTRMWRLKVEIQRNDNPNDIWVDISDRVLQCSISHDYERRNSTANIELDNFDASLSPFNRNSSTNFVGGVYNPLLDAMHKIRVSYGLLTTAGYEYIVKFTGLLGDDIDTESYPSQISLACRDLSKYLQDTYIFQSKTYKTTVVENVMQDMISQFVPELGLTVQIQNDTKFMIGRPDQPYTAKDINLWDALQQLADAASHELRFLEDGRLILRKIVRDFTGITPVAIFDESQLVKDTLNISDADIRNHIVLKVQGLNPIEKVDAHSVAQYGRRYMEVHRSMANIITTAEQGHQLVQDMLYDLSHVAPNDNLELALYPQIQVGDFVAVRNTQTGTDPTYDIFRVIRVQDRYTANSKRTTLQLKGKTSFIPEESIAPRPPTNLRASLISRQVFNYPNSGWAGDSKTTYYPQIQWDAPTANISGTGIGVDFGGYTIYRKDDLHAGMVNVGSVRWAQVSGNQNKWWQYPASVTTESSLQGDYIITTSGQSMTIKMLNPLKPNDNWSVVVNTQFSGGAYRPKVDVFRSGNSVKTTGAMPLTLGTAVPVRVDIISGNVNVYTGNVYTTPFCTMAIPSGVSLRFDSIRGFVSQDYAYVQNLKYKGNDWYPVATIASYIPSMNLKVQHFYDYTVSGGAQYEYKMTAVDKLGAVSTSSQILSIAVQPTTYATLPSQGSGG